MAEQTPPTPASYKYVAIGACKLAWPLTDISETIESEAEQSGTTRSESISAALKESEAVVIAMTRSASFKEHFCADMQQRLEALGE
jgi:hypothetical protein